ncbi:MAG: alpha/beta hydrolase [Alicyclobacillus sp.]|nr:alpha/beta hydrolase [Alicyclobacillus sp.]
MALDERLQRLIGTVIPRESLPPDPVDPVAVRAARNRVVRQTGALRPVAKVEDQTVSGPGGNIPVRVYWPRFGARLPVLVYLHGGGWVFGTLDSVDDTCRALANAADCVVVSVDYRLAPEHKFPAAVEDAYAVLRWLSDHAPEIGADAGRLAVGGESAGGNLAIACTLLARDQGGPSLVAQLLAYPITDYNLDTASYRENAEGFFLTRRAMQWYWEQYLARPEDADNPLAAPLRAVSHAGLPPALIFTAEYDPLRDDGEAYAARLRAAGVPVAAVRMPGLIHGFFSNAQWQLPQREEALARAADFLRQAFTRPDPAAD